MAQRRLRADVRRLAGHHPGAQEGRTVASRDLGLDLGRSCPAPRLPRARRLGKLRRGRYSLWLRVTDPVGYLAPMNLAIAGRQADGAYRIGMVRVARRSGH